MCNFLTSQDIILKSLSTNQQQDISALKKKLNNSSEACFSSCQMFWQTFSSSQCCSFHAASLPPVSMNKFPCDKSSTAATLGLVHETSQWCLRTPDLVSHKQKGARKFAAEVCLRHDDAQESCQSSLPNSHNRAISIRWVDSKRQQWNDSVASLAQLANAGSRSVCKLCSSVNKQLPISGHHVHSHDLRQCW